MKKNHDILWIPRAADEIKLTLLPGATCWWTGERKEITEICRRVRQAPTAKLGSEMARELKEALLARGVRCTPDLESAGLTDPVRLTRIDTYMGWIEGLFTLPSPTGDSAIANIITKLKGRRIDDGHDEEVAA